MTSTRYYRAGLALAAVTVAFLVLGSGALGIIGGGEADRVYVGVVAVALVGTVVSRLRALGLAYAMAAAAVAQVVAPVVAFAADLDGTATAPVSDVVMLTVLYAGLFATAALAFTRASAGPSAPSPSRSAAVR